MNQPTRNQHYVWRSYLAAWTNTNSPKGQIICLRDNRIFPVSLMKVALENSFYGVKELTQQERDLVFEMTIKNKTGVQRSICEQWLNVYCAPFDFVDEITAGGYSIFGHSDRIKIKKDQEFKNWNIEHIEKIHTYIESSGAPYISSLRQNNLDFWEEEFDRDKFSFYICNQYFRTKKTRDSIIRAFEIVKSSTKHFTSICPENIWIPLSFIFASNLGVYITQNYSAVLLQTNNAFFIVGDQPVINTYSTFDMMTAPTDVELFYPITPQSALLLTTDSKYTSGQVLNISADDVQKYNLLEWRSAREIVFAKERTHLETFVSPSG